MERDLLQEFLYIKEGVGMILNNINDINKKLGNLSDQINLARTINLTTQNEIKALKAESTEYKQLLMEIKFNPNHVPAGSSAGGEFSDENGNNRNTGGATSPSPKEDGRADRETPIGSDAYKLPKETIGGDIDNKPVKTKLDVQKTIKIANDNTYKGKTVSTVKEIVQRKCVKL